MKKNVLILMDDIHLEGRPPENHRDFALKIKQQINTIKLAGDNPIIICAGDIGEGIEGVKWASQFECDIIYICGNHEFWGQDFYDVPKNIKSFIEKPENSHIKFLDKESVILNGTRFIGATLWTSLGKFLPWLDKNYVIRFFGTMGDFKRTTAHEWFTIENIHRLKLFMKHNGVEEERIKEIIDKELFNPLLEIEENKIATNFFIKELNEDYKGETVVISHHLPVYQMWMKKMKMTQNIIEGDYTNNEKFFQEAANGNSSSNKNSLLMSFYCNDLAELMYNKKAPNYWLHGHLHMEMEEIVGKTKIISNPIGYLRQSQEMKLKTITINRNNNEFLISYIKKEIEKYDWTENLYNTIRDFEKVINKFELGVSIDILNSVDFYPVLKNFKIIHEINIKNLNLMVKEWLKIFIDDNDNELYEKELDIYIIKKKLNFNDTKFNFLTVLKYEINDFSFASEDVFHAKSQNLDVDKIYYYKEWLKELNKLQIQLTQYKKALLEFCDSKKAL